LEIISFFKLVADHLQSITIIFGVQEYRYNI
jgi:hypothetical protein